MRFRATQRARIEIGLAGYEPIGFDVFVQPGETLTYRANIY